MTIELLRSHVLQIATDMHAIKGILGDAGTAGTIDQRCVAIEILASRSEAIANGIWEKKLDMFAGDFADRFK